jgi:hypothetical protein
MKGETRLWREGLVYGGGDSCREKFFLWWNKTVKSCLLIYTFRPVKSCPFLHPLVQSRHFSVHVILWYKNV